MEWKKKNSSFAGEFGNNLYSISSITLNGLQQHIYCEEAFTLIVKKHSHWLWRSIHITCEETSIAFLAETQKDV